MFTGAFFLEPGTSVAGFNFDPECYGETLEIIDPHIDVAFSLPIRLRPQLVPFDRSVAGDQERREAWDQTCHPEPVPIASFYFINGGNPIPLLGLTEDGPLPKRFRMAVVDIEHERRFERAIASYKKQYGYLPVITEDGFEFYGHPNNNGIYISPEIRVNSAENRVKMRCNFASLLPGECFVIIDVQGVSLEYWFDPGKYPLKQWFELDMRMRNMMNMIVIRASDR